MVLTVSCCLCAAVSAKAQETIISPPEIGPSGQEYQRAIRYRGIDTDVVYFDPSQPAPPLDTDFSPKQETRDSGRTISIENQWGVGLVSALVLIFLVAFVYFGAGRMSVSFRTSADNARRKAGQTPSERRAGDGEASSLSAILAQRNLDLAVSALAQLVLSHCLSANEVLFKRSWTHREALQNLPQSLWYIPDLRALILESERVNFGHRSISQHDFDALLERVRPILQEGRA